MKPVAPISIAMCTYNGELYLQEQLDSFLVQTRMPDELVVCDDGSSDGTVKILRHFASSAPFQVRIVENSSRLGSTANFCNAIGLSNGDIIVLSDQDDVWYPRKLQCIEKAFLCSHNVGAIFSNGRLINERTQSFSENLWRKIGFGLDKQKLVRSKQGFDILLRGNFVTGATLAFRAKFKEFLLPIPTEWVHDYWIATLFSACAQLDFIEDELIQYRCHAAQQLGVRRSMLDKWRHLIKGDRQIYRDVALRWAEVYERLDRLKDGNMLSAMVRCEEMIKHLNFRGTLPQYRLIRLRYMLPQIANGNYFRYSLGLSSILRDLIVP